MYMYGLLASF